MDRRYAVPISERIRQNRAERERRRNWPWQEPWWPKAPYTPPVVPVIPPNPVHPWTPAPWEPNPTVAVCGACGLNLKQTMMYCCPRGDCPTGLGPTIC